MARAAPAPELGVRLKGLTVATIVARNYLAYARVLSESLRRQHPELAHHVLVADEDATQAGRRDEPFRVLTLDDLDIDHLQPLLFGYDRKQLLAALKPTLLRHLLDVGLSSVLYLDADMWVLDDLGPVLERVTSHALTLTPHVGMAATCAHRLARERLLLLAGMYNAGFVGATDCSETRTFLEWWEMRVRDHCDSSVRKGLHYDQRWLDLAPGFVDDLHLVRDAGVNVAYWNLPDLETRLHEGHLLVDGRRCRLFHFSGFDPEAPDRATYYAPDLRVDDLGAAAPLFGEYQQRLEHAGHHEAREVAWPWSRFSNGVAIRRRDRRRYRALGAAAQRFGDPFDTRHRPSYYRSLRDPGALARRVWRRLGQLQRLRRRRHGAHTER